MSERERKEKEALAAIWEDEDAVEGDTERGKERKTDRKADETKGGLPHACYICRSTFTAPVQTQCKHYFCQRCILSSLSKSQACPVCGKDTQGLLTDATRQFLAAGIAINSTKGRKTQGDGHARSPGGDVAAGRGEQEDAGGWTTVQEDGGGGGWTTVQ